MKRFITVVMISGGLMLGMLIACPTISAADYIPKPKFYVHKGNIPGHGGKTDFHTTGRVKLFHKPSLKSPVVTIIPPDVSLGYLTSEIHVIPGLIEFTKDAVIKEIGVHYRKGDQLVVLNYMADGFFLVWADGRIYDEYLMDVSWNKYSCQPSDCVAIAIKEPIQTVWVRVSSKFGTGWVVLNQTVTYRLVFG